MSSSAIQIRNFSFNYGDKNILQDISFVVEEGEYVSLIGSNGVGKSTLLKCINRIINGGQGAIELFGKNLIEYSQKDLGKMIGYVPQSRDHIFPYTVYEFVLMGRYPYLTPLSRPSKADKEIVQQALAITGTEEFRERKVSHLSGGERQKVYLAASLAQQPKILILDEPTAHLDPRYHREIQQTISGICADSGITILHVTHDLNHIALWSHKVLAFKEGRVCWYGTPEDVLTAEHLEHIFNTPFLFMEHPLTKKNMIIPEAL